MCFLLQGASRAASGCLVALFGLTVAISLACTGRRAREVDLTGRVGIVRIGSDAVCLALANPALPRGMNLSVVQTDVQRTMPAVVDGPSADCAGSSAGSSEVHGYQLRLEGSSPAPAIAIGIVTDGVRFGQVDNSVTADLDGDARPEFFRSCTSNEGVHLTIWSDAPLTGQRRWHGYHPLGYDVTPTCTAAETRAVN